MLYRADPSGETHPNNPQYPVMLNFASSQVRIVKTVRAVEECLESALGDAASDCSLLLVHAGLGHDFREIAAAARRVAPKVRVAAASCCGVVGRDGVSESVKDMAVMAVRGDDFVVARVDGVTARNALEKCADLGRQLRQAGRTIRFIYLLSPGIDIANDRCLAGLESVLGVDVPVFGATSSDNMKGIVSIQSVDGEVSEHSAFAIGFTDESIDVDSQATHGFVAVGDPMIVTRSEANEIHELNGRPAWLEFTHRLGLSPEASCGDSIPIGALAEELPAELAAEYGNPHILRVVTSRAGNVMHYATDCPVGTHLWLTKRDESLIFSDMERLTRTMLSRAGGRTPVAVFHADCLARGRFLFDRILKEELVNRMQFPFKSNGVCPPWLGMYGFGEYAKLNGRNCYHNYTTALCGIYRRTT